MKKLLLIVSFIACVAFVASPAIALTNTHNTISCVSLGDDKDKKCDKKCSDKEKGSCCKKEQKKGCCNKGATTGGETGTTK